MRIKIKDRLQAKSFENGIKIYSNRYDNCYAVATRTEKGEIEVEWKKEKDFIKYFVFIFFILVIICNIYKNEILCIVELYLRDIVRIYVVFLNIAFLVEAFRIGTSNRKLKKYHGAEHMVINSYYELKRVPDIKEVRNYSRFHKSCGTNASVKILVISWVLYKATYMEFTMQTIVSLGMIILFIVLLFATKIMNWLQYFTTSNPTDQELEVAIQALTVWEQNEKQ